MSTLGNAAEGVTDLERPQRTNINRIISAIIQHWPLLVILNLAAFLRFAGSRDLWIDEITSIGQATAPNLLGVIENAPVMHPPLYHMSLHVWINWFGSGPGSVRALSIFIGILAVAAVYFLGVRFLGRNQGAIAGLIAAIAPFHVWYSQEVRMYVFVLFFATLSMYYFLRLVDGDRRSVIWIAYIATTLLMVYSHYSGLILLALEITFAMYLWLTRRGEASESPVVKSPRLRWVILGLLLIAPLFALFMTKFLSTSLHEFIAQNSFPVTMGTFAEVMVGYHTVGMQLKQSAAWSLALYLAPLALLGSRQLLNVRTQFLIWVVVGTALLVYLASEVIHPLLMHPRFFSAGFPALVLLLASVLTTRYDKVRKLPVVIVFLVLAVATYDQGTNLQNRMSYQNVTALQYVAEALEPGDLVLYTPPYADRIFEYYDVANLGKPLEVPSLSGLGDNEFDIESEVMNNIAGVRRVFYIYTFDNLDPRVPEIVIEAKRVLRDQYPLESGANLNNIEVRCYSRGIACPPSVSVDGLGSRSSGGA